MNSSCDVTVWRPPPPPSKHDDIYGRWYVWQPFGWPRPFSPHCVYKALSSALSFSCCQSPNTNLISSHFYLFLPCRPWTQQTPSRSYSESHQCRTVRHSRTVYPIDIHLPIERYSPVYILWTVYPAPIVSFYHLLQHSDFPQLIFWPVTVPFL